MKKITTKRIFIALCKCRGLERVLIKEYSEEFGGDTYLYRTKHGKYFAVYTNLKKGGETIMVFNRTTVDGRYGCIEFVSALPKEELIDAICHDRVMASSTGEYLDRETCFAAIQKIVG